jgi:hypothetical protein
MKNKSGRILRRKFGSRRRHYTLNERYQSYFYSDETILKLQIPHGICSKDDPKLLLSKQWFNHHFNGEKYYSENGLKDLLEATINVEDLEYRSFT